MGWQSRVTNRIYPDYAHLVTGLDTGEQESSINTDQPVADKNELIIFSSTDDLTADEQDELKALITTIADTYNLKCSHPNSNSGYIQYTLTYSGGEEPRKHPS